MRELELNVAQSSRNSLVFELDGEQVFLAVSDELRHRLVEALSDSDTTSGGSSNAAQVTPPPLREGSSPDSSSPQQEEEPSSGPDPRLSAPLRMRPRQIQDRIRAGATVAELAQENNVTEARIEPYAHPVLLERARIADMAKQAHPVRDDGPAKLTLWEVLATAFAARGHDLSQAQWDAYRNEAQQWIITISWTVGQTTNTAEYSYLNHLTSSPTAVARNPLASEMINPDFSRPGRSLSSVDDEHVDIEGDVIDDFDSAEELHGPGTRNTDSGEDDGFLQHPQDGQPPRQRKRRKAKTPHWEDVLLGVRSNTKRPRS